MSTDKLPTEKELNIARGNIDKEMITALENGVSLTVFTVRDIIKNIESLKCIRGRDPLRSSGADTYVLQLEAELQFRIIEATTAKHYLK